MPGRFRLRCAVTKELAGTIDSGDEVALVNTTGEIVGILEVTDVFEWDKQKYLSKVYGTDRTDHPGADMVLAGNADKTHLLGGTIHVLPQPKHPRFGKYVLTPLEVRALLAEKGWDRVVAFQTRNPLHRAHEYALVYGLETLLKQGHNAGACLNPLIGETKGDDVDADVRMHTYEALIDDRALGEGDSDPELWEKRGESVPDRVILLGLDIKMFYGGPAEAVMHGIYAAELRLHRHHHRPQTRRRSLPRWDTHLGRLRRPAYLRGSEGRPEDQPGQSGLRRLLRIPGPRRPDGKPPRRKTGLHLRQASPRDAPGRRGSRPSNHAAQHIEDSGGGNGGEVGIGGLGTGDLGLGIWDWGEKKTRSSASDATPRAS